MHKIVIYIPRNINHCTLIKANKGNIIIPPGRRHQPWIELSKKMRKRTLTNTLPWMQESKKTHTSSIGYRTIYWLSTYIWHWSNVWCILFKTVGANGHKTTLDTDVDSTWKYTGGGLTLGPVHQCSPSDLALESIFVLGGCIFSFFSFPPRHKPSE